jgi:phosphatidylserine/phosphatidylglycerophosphate/cardiolipin synthase-like enzyme
MVTQNDGAQDSVIKRVIGWSNRKKLNYNVSSEHFFIEGDLLNRLCLNVFDYSKTEVVVVNPNVYPCSLSDKLKETGDRTIKLITRSPSSEGKKTASRQKYHEVLLKNGVRIFYNDRIHAKMILSDGKLGIVSSLNFKSKSSSGRNLEAGMTTWQIDAIESIKKYVDNLLNDDETEEYTI